jgi:hypothetical protein
MLMVIGAAFAFANLGGSFLGFSGSCCIAEIWKIRTSDLGSARSKRPNRPFTT